MREKEEKKRKKIGYQIFVEDRSRDHIVSGGGRLPRPSRPRARKNPPDSPESTTSKALSFGVRAGKCLRSISSIGCARCVSFTVSHSGCNAHAATRQHTGLSTEFQWDCDDRQRIRRYDGRDTITLGCISRGGIRSLCMTSCAIRVDARSTCWVLG